MGKEQRREGRPGQRLPFSSSSSLESDVESTLQEEQEARSPDRNQQTPSPFKTVAEESFTCLMARANSFQPGGVGEEELGAGMEGIKRINDWYSITV